MSIAKDSIVPDALRRQYHDEGYFILESVIPPDMLSLLREECHYFIGYADGKMDAEQNESQGANHRSQRYFISGRYRQSKRLWRFIYSDLMADVATASLGPDVYLFHEQWVVKGPEIGLPFAWHQDSGYVNATDPGNDHQPYLTCWCPLDDVSQANGTVYLLPHSRGGTKGKIVEHIKDPQYNDLIGYTGDDPGIQIEVPAGSIVCFSSFNLHCSGPNTSQDYRRVYLPQYSSHVIHHTRGHPWAQAVPFVRDGRIAYDQAEDFART